MANGKSLSHLTRSLMLGASVGTIALTQVGCAPATTTSNAAADGAGATQNVSLTGNEKVLCDRALESRAASDVNALMSQHPGSSCVVPLLSAMPPATLAALSTSTLTSLDRSVQMSMPREVISRLPVGYRNVRNALNRQATRGGAETSAAY